MIVLDASAAVDLLVPGELGATVADRVLHGADSLHAPHLIDVEVASALRRYVARDVIDAGEGELALQQLRELRIVRYPHEHLLDRAWELRHTITAQDAMYVTLAEALDAPLVTTDAALARSSGHRAVVELIAAG